MDFTPQRQQQLYGKALRDLVDSNIVVPVAGKHEQPGHSPDEIVEPMKQLVVFGMLVRSGFGGLDLEMGSFALTFEKPALCWMGSGRRSDTESGMGKYFASEDATQYADSIRIHGSYGYSTEFEVERLYRDAPLMAIGEGTNDLLRTVVATALLAGRATVG